MSKYYDYNDTVCHCGCGSNFVNDLLLEYLDKLCDMAGTKLELTNVCRCEEHNAEVGGVRGSQHTLGTAADVAVPYGMTVDELGELAIEVGFDGVGKYYEDEFVHVDVRSGGTEAGCYLWTDED